MIVKRHFTPASMWPYARLELLLGAASSVAAWLLVGQAGWTYWSLPAAVATVLGTALSILLAVRANTSYQRWEGSAIWAQIVGLSRNLVRVVVSVSNSKTAVDPAAVCAFQRDVAHRQIAYVIALRAQLRGHDYNELADPLARLQQAEHDMVTAADNKALTLLACQSARIFAAYGDGLLTGLDNFQMETAVISTLPEHGWLVIPATLIVAFAFRMVERIGSVVEAPFGNTIQDVPLTAVGDRLPGAIGVTVRPCGWFRNGIRSRCG